MRKYLRAIARHRMKAQGIERINRKAAKSGKSFFALNWRKALRTLKKNTKRISMRVA